MINFYNNAPKLPGLNPPLLFTELVQLLKNQQLNEEGKKLLLIEIYDKYFGQNTHQVTQTRKLIDSLKQKKYFFNENILIDSVSGYYLLKSLQDVFYKTFPSKKLNPKSNSLFEEFSDFNSLENFLIEIEHLNISKFLGVPDGVNSRPILHDNYGFRSESLRKDYEKINTRLDELYKNLNIKSIIDFDTFKKQIYRLLDFDLDILLHTTIYYDFFSIVYYPKISYRRRLLIMFEVFVITHGLTPGMGHPAFKGFNTWEEMDKDKDYANYRIREVCKILSKYTSTHSI